MTRKTARTLKAGDRVRWNKDDADLGTVRAVARDAVAITWDNAHARVVEDRERDGVGAVHQYPDESAWCALSDVLGDRNTSEREGVEFIEAYNVRLRERFKGAA